MVRREVLQARFIKLQEYLKILKDLQRYSEKEFVQNPIIHGSVERYLHLSIEALIDISNHLLRDLNFRAPTDNADTFRVLAEEKVIPEKFSEKLVLMAKFRNILVHDYLKLDLKRIHSHLKENLKDFTSFEKHLKKYL